MRPTTTCKDCDVTVDAALTRCYPCEARANRTRLSSEGVKFPRCLCAPSFHMGDCAICAPPPPVKCMGNCGRMIDPRPGAPCCPCWKTNAATVKCASCPMMISALFKQCRSCELAMAAASQARTALTDVTAVDLAVYKSERLMYAWPSVAKSPEPTTVVPPLATDVAVTGDIAVLKAALAAHRAILMRMATLLAHVNDSMAPLDTREAIRSALREAWDLVEPARAAAKRGGR